MWQEVPNVHHPDALLMSLTGAPLEILKQLESTEVPESYSGEFECVVSREDAEGSWFFGEKQLSPSSKYVICSRRGRHSLTVKDVKKEDQGRYTFKVGEFQSGASLKMKCKLWAGGPLTCLSLDLQTAQTWVEMETCRPCL